MIRRPHPRAAGSSRKTRGTRTSGVSREPTSTLRAEVASALINQGYAPKTARAKAAKASGADFTSLFRSAMQQNPRVLPEMTDTQIAAIRKLIKGNAMAQKKKKSKKKNARRRKMPAGLARYWAKKRAQKNARRRNSAKKRKATKRRKPSLRVRNYRKPARRASKPRRRNPIRKLPQHIDLGSGFTASQIKKVTRAVARITGKKARWVKR